MQPITPDAACKAYAKARCAKLKSCSDFLFEYVKPADLDACANAITSVSCDVTGGGSSCFYPAVCELGKCVVPTASASAD